MNKEEVIEKLQLNQKQLQSRGILHAAVFGSVARGEAKNSSDIDILIDLDPCISMDIYTYVNLKRFIASLFPIPTDVVNSAALKEEISFNAQCDAIYAF